MPKPIRIGPSWIGVFFGAFFSLLLGVVLGALFLILKPVVIVKEPLKPADKKAADQKAADQKADVNVIYYTEGTRDGSKSRQADAKRKTFAAGGSIAVTEDEINVLIAPKPPAAAPPAAKPKPKPGESPVPLTADATPLPPNFRIKSGVMQIASPTKLSALGVETTLVVLARGDFQHRDGRFVFEPASISIGSLPLDRFPVVNTFVFNKFIGAQPVPEDIARSWGKLVAVHIEGNELKLTMP